MSEPAISVSGLSKQYRLGARQHYKTLRESLSERAARLMRLRRAPAPETIWALDDVSFEVPSGELLGVIGPNGAGKSTLLKILSRITEPTRGRAVIAGRVGSMLEVGTGFHPELTGRENTFLSGAILGMGRHEIRAKFDEIVAFAEIEDFLDTPVKRYSSGMYVRLAFSVAAHLEPEILLIDEVLAVGDAAFQRKCLGLMGEVAGEGRTVLFVSHNMAAVMQLTRKGILLDGGRLAAHGPTGEVVQQYLASLQEESSTVYEVLERPRPYAELTRAVEFVRLELEGAPTAFLSAEADLQVLLTVRGNQAVDPFRFSLTISRLDGVAVGNVFAPEAQSIQSGEQTTYRMQLSDLRLAPGMYSCAVAVGQGSHLTRRREFDLLRDVLHFEVLSDGEKEGITGEWYGSWGAIRFKPPRITRVRH
jgi:lipopolysaccharide transport system ATP-binding protein